MGVKTTLLGRLSKNADVDFIEHFCTDKCTTDSHRELYMTHLVKRAEIKQTEQIALFIQAKLGMSSVANLIKKEFLK